MSKRDEHKATYEKWWLHQWVTGPYDSAADAKLVTRVTVYGAPSFVYGFATLTFSDGSERNVNNVSAFRPRKKDIRVWTAQEVTDALEQRKAQQESNKDG